MSTKEEFNALLNKHEYPSVRNFCYAHNIDYANMNKRVNGQRQKIEIGFMFRLANMLHEPVDVIVKIFYPNEYEENQALCKHVKDKK